MESRILDHWDFLRVVMDEVAWQQRAGNAPKEILHFSVIKRTLPNANDYIEVRFEELVCDHVRFFQA